MPSKPEIVAVIDAVLADLADERAEYRLTTVGYLNKSWKIPPHGTHWSNGDLFHDAATIKLESLKDALRVVSVQAEAAAAAPSPVRR